MSSILLGSSSRVQQPIRCPTRNSVPSVSFGKHREASLSTFWCSGFKDRGHTVYYQSIECGSKQKKTYKPGKVKADKRGRVDTLVAEVETLMSRIEHGQQAALPQSSLASYFLQTPASPSSSSSSSSSSESDSSGSESEHSPAAAPAVDFERQQQELLARIAAGSSAQPAPPCSPPASPTPPEAVVPAAAAAAASTAHPVYPGAGAASATNNVVSRGQWGGVAAARVEVCMGKACTKRGAPQLLAELQGAAAGVKGGAGVSVSACTKCMGKCKAAPNVRVTTPSGGRTLYGGVSPAAARSLVQGVAGAQAEYFA